MLASPRLRSWLFAVIAVVLITAAIPAVAAAQAPWGELSSFGSRGVGNGQFSEEGTETEAFGVDPTDESIYVGDKPSGKTFRIQKFDSSGKFLGAATIKSLPGEGALEGVAIDPVEHRFYALITLTRSGELPLGPEETAAAEVFAFSTTPTGEVLEPAPGTVEGGILVSKTVLKPSSIVPGQPLLEPSGITVDPTTHDIILMGLEEKVAEEPRVALQRISSAGALGQRWTDSTGSPYFDVQNDAGSSPVVTSTGKVLVEAEAPGALSSSTEQIVEIPSSFSGAAKPYLEFEPGAADLVTFPGEPHPLEGGGLSLGSDGTLWAYAKILNGTGRLPGVLGFSTTGTPAERGWTGGQSIKFGSGKCVISFLGQPLVAAGKETVWMFDSNGEAPRVVHFGPGGEGCPTAHAASIEAAEGARKIEGSETITPGAEVHLSTTLAGANALKVKWTFGDGSAEVLTTNQHQTPTELHKFVGEGEFKVTETIETDDLATPTIALERTLLVSKPLPIAKFTARTPVLVGEADGFDAKASAGVEGAPITQYRWTFGDGASETTTTSSASHAYAAAGSYTVTLRVLAHERLSGTASAAITVNAPTTTTTSTTSTATSTAQTSSPSHEVLSYTLSVPASALTANKGGAVAVKLDCAGKSSCAGSVTLKTASAISAGKHKKKAVLTLGSGSFKASGGQIVTVTVHLSSAARKLLSQSGSRGLKVRVTILARGVDGSAHTTTVLATLHVAKAAKHH